MKNLIILTFLFFAACSNHSSVPDSANTKARYIFSDKNGLFGLLDENGKEVIPAEYLYIDKIKDRKQFRSGKADLNQSTTMQLLLRAKGS